MENLYLPAVFVTIILLSILVYFVYRLNQYSLFSKQESIDNVIPIGGWLFLVGIGITITPIRMVIEIFTNQMLSNEIWVNVPNQLGSEGVYLKLLLWVETIFNVSLLIFSIFCAYLFYNKRNTLPKFIIIFYCFSCVIQVFDTAALSFFSFSSQKEISNSLLEVGRSVIPLVIWVPYFLNSKRVKQTFVIPFSDDYIIENDNNQSEIDIIGKELE